MESVGLQGFVSSCTLLTGVRGKGMASLDNLQFEDDIITTKFSKIFFFFITSPYYQ